MLLAGTTDGDMWMWKMPGGDCKTFQGHGCACGTGEIFPDGVSEISTSLYSILVSYSTWCFESFVHRKVLDCQCFGQKSNSVSLYI